MKKLLILSLLLLTISGCSSLPKLPDLVQTQNPNANFMPPIPQPANMRNVQFMVLNKDSIAKLVADAKKNGNSNQLVFIAMTTKDYENLALNFSELQRYIQDQYAVIVLTTKMIRNNQ